jgi:GNAT superfamily N-acetyltransferase
VTVRRSTPADLPVLQTIWQEVFGDPPAFTGRFYETFGADCAIVAEEDDGIVGMIHPLPVALAQNGQYSFGVYIYALATIPSYRGRGIAYALLCAAESAPFVSDPSLAGAESMGLPGNFHLTPAFSLLIPGSESLFSYYRNRGYDRTARVISEISDTYTNHLRLGLSDQPVFLKPEHFFSLSERMWEPIPPPVDRALWKAISPDLPNGKPTLSHFMQ